MKNEEDYYRLRYKHSINVHCIHHGVFRITFVMNNNPSNYSVTYNVNLLLI